MVSIHHLLRRQDRVEIVALLLHSALIEISIEELWENLSLL